MMQTPLFNPEGYSYIPIELSSSEQEEKVSRVYKLKESIGKHYALYDKDRNVREFWVSVILGKIDDVVSLEREKLELGSRSSVISLIKDVDKEQVVPGCKRKDFYEKILPEAIRRAFEEGIEKGYIRRIPAKAINRNYNIKEKWSYVFDNLPLHFVSLERLNLEHFIFCKSSLIKANCRGAIFTAADLTAANLTEADFTGAVCTPFGGDLSSGLYKSIFYAPTMFTRANCSKANFTGANLTEADFTEANLTRVCFTDATLTDVQFGGTIFEGCKDFAQYCTGKVGGTFKKYFVCIENHAELFPGFEELLSEISSIDEKEEEQATCSAIRKFITTYIKKVEKLENLSSEHLNKLKDFCRFSSFILKYGGYKPDAELSRLIAEAKVRVSDVIDKRNSPMTMNPPLTLAQELAKAAFGDVQTPHPRGQMQQQADGIVKPPWQLARSAASKKTAKPLPPSFSLSTSCSSAVADHDKLWRMKQFMQQAVKHSGQQSTSQTTTTQKKSPQSTSKQ